MCTRTFWVAERHIPNTGFLSALADDLAKLGPIDRIEVPTNLPQNFRETLMAVFGVENLETLESQKEKAYNVRILVSC